MPPAAQSEIDPLKSFMAGAFDAGTRRPCPLIATRFDVIIDGGLAVVATSRTFRNVERSSIEVTITFPVPVHAVLFALEARTGERVLKAHVRRKDQARADYEEALERGKSAVLHEEVLRGVHMLSVGHLAPNAEIEVRATWAMPLTNVNGHGRLTIPLTVGDVYGRSGLADSDELIHGGLLQAGTLTVDCRDGTATLLGSRLQDGQAAISLNAPVEIEVAGWTPRDLPGRAADGGSVTLRIAPHGGGEAALDLALIIDHSGSMNERLSGAHGAVSKHQAAVAALATAAQWFSAADIADLWEFDDNPGHIGSTRDAPLRGLIASLSVPHGGTEIGRALECVIARSAARDVLLITDGKSHALDVQALAQSGRRFSVVLIGSDSLEARVGHLAALSGGEIFVAASADIAAVVAAAIRALRHPRDASSSADAIREHRGGMELSARLKSGDASSDQTIESRAAAAVVANLRLSGLSENAAAALAEAEGLVTHLTSLILVDEAAAAQDGIPSTRKIALRAPDTFNDLMAAALPPASRAMMAMPFKRMRPSATGTTRSFHIGGGSPSRPASDDNFSLRAFMASPPTAPPQDDIAALSAQIDWDNAPGRLHKGDLSSLDRNLGRIIRDLAKDAACVDWAKKIGCTPVVLVIGLLASAAAGRSRSAERVARGIIGDKLAPAVVAAITRHLSGG